MLEYSVLQLYCVVIASFYANDIIIHSTSLALLCISLIHHSSNYKSNFIGHLDRTLCKIFSICCLRKYILYNYNYPFYYNIIVSFLAIYMFILYYILKVHEYSKILHASIHTSATIVGIILCIY